MPHPSYTDKLEALVWALAHGVSAFQTGYATPWEAHERDDDPGLWEIHDNIGLVIMETYDNELEEGQLAKDLVTDICKNVNLADRLLTALVQSGVGVTISEETVGAAYELLPEKQKKWRK